MLKMQMRRSTTRCFKVPSFVAVIMVGVCVGTVTGQSPVDRFIAGLDADPAIPADAVRLIRETWAKCQDCDGDEFLTQGLALLSPKFRDGLDAYDAGRNEQCAGIMGALRQDPNAFVAMHAAAYEIKALVAMGRLLEAGERIEQLLGDKPEGLSRVGKYSYLAPEIAFLQGYCLLTDLQYGATADALYRFLDTYPDASQRLVISARQMLAELENRQPGRIGEVADLMDYAGRRLTHWDSGVKVRERQQRIIDILDRLIEDAEDLESNSSSSSSSSGGDSGQRGGQEPNNPMQDSMLPGGRPPEGPLQSGRRANPGEVWGSMPPAERERILQALRDNFPSRYRRLVEQYYEQLAKKP